MRSDKGASATKHIAVLAFPFGTHAAPLLDLTRRISAAAPDVSFSFFSTAKSNDSNFPKNGEAIHNLKPYNVSDGLPEGFVFRGNPLEPVEQFLRAAPGNFKSAMDAAVAETGKGIDCLLTDAFHWFCADLAQELHVPWVALWTAGPRALFLHVETDNIRRQLGTSSPKDRTLDFLPEFSAIFDSDLAEEVAFGNLDTPFPQTLHKMGLTLSRATAVVANSFDDLDAPVVDMLKSRFQKFLNVGPFNLASVPPQIADTHGCLEFLDKHGPGSVVYISFGSYITPPPHELAALAEALEETGLPFLWSFRGNAEQLLPKGFMERRSTNKGKIVPWAPQMDVLEHPSVVVFITHGGWNSTLESIIGGVPMICRPFFGDQKMNMRTLESVWGIGLGTEGGTITKHGTIKALNLILSSEEGKRMREKIGVLKKLAFKAVAPNGSSTINFKTLLMDVTVTKH